MCPLSEIFCFPRNTTHFRIDGSFCRFCWISCACDEWAKLYTEMCRYSIMSMKFCMEIIALLWYWIWLPFFCSTLSGLLKIFSALVTRHPRASESVYLFYIDRLPNNTHGRQSPPSNAGEYTTMGCQPIIREAQLFPKVIMSGEHNVGFRFVHVGDNCMPVSRSMMKTMSAIIDNQRFI